jgi:hypothetical protein
MQIVYTAQLDTTATENNALAASREHYEKQKRFKTDSFKCERLQK